MIGALIPVVVYAVVVALHRALPARRVAGYVREGGKPLEYRLNGLAVFAIVVALFCGGAHLGWWPWDLLWTYRFAALGGAVVLGLIFTAAIVLPAPPVASLARDLFFGRWANPQAHGIDAKMILYLVGAVMLGLNTISFAAHHGFAPGIALYAALLLFFVTEYLLFEEVHLYTYDFVAERVGFKLGWGCIAFYPYFYCIGLWSAADRPSTTPLWLCVVAAVVFFTGWALSRGANLQKFRFKTRGTGETITDGTHTLLCGGLWGVARHVNYLGEIAMALGLTLALGRLADPLPWLYPVYYVALLVPRQLDDDRRCAAKYGALWEQYEQRVPYRIIPGVY